MGPPGAGKGTQARHIVERYGLRHVATGDVLRENVQRDTELGRVAKGYMDSGQLVPDELIIDMLRALIADLPEGQGVLLDGFPRTVAQAEALESMLDALGRRVDLALDIEVPADVLVERLSSRWICRTCGTSYNAATHPPQTPGVCDLDGGELYQRDDDTPGAVRKRLEVYAEQTAPVSAFYENCGVRRVLDGNRDRAVVEDAIDDAFAALAA